MPTINDFVRWLQANGISQTPIPSPEGHPDWTPISGIEPPKELYFSRSSRTKLGISQFLLEQALEQSLTNPQALDPFFMDIQDYLLGNNTPPKLSWQTFITPVPSAGPDTDPRIASKVDPDVVKDKARIWPTLIDPTATYYYWAGQNTQTPPSGSRLTNTITGQKYLVVTIPGLIAITWLQQL